MLSAAAGLYWTQRGTEEDRSLAVAQRDATAEQAKDVAGDLLEACRGGFAARAPGSCEQAERVQAAPVAGPQGDAGASGRDGRDGKDGRPGRDGVDGTPGRDGVDGAPGKDGVDGKDGAPGRDGVDGAPGRDGVDGPPGPPGAPGGSCPPGEERQPYTWPDGVSGSRCVTAPPPAQATPAAPTLAP